MSGDDPVTERWVELYDNAKTWQAQCFAAQKKLAYVEAQLAHGVTKAAVRRPVGPVLCSWHARQVANERRLPEGPCERETWTAGDGRTVTCDVIANPDKVTAYLGRAG